MKLIIERKKDLTEELSCGRGYVFIHDFKGCALSTDYITDESIFVIVRTSKQIYIAKDGSDYVVMHIIAQNLNDNEHDDFILGLDETMRKEIHKYASGDKWVFLESYTL